MTDKKVTLTNDGSPKQNYQLTYNVVESLVIGVVYAIYYGLDGTGNLVVQHLDILVEMLIRLNILNRL